MNKYLAAMTGATVSGAAFSALVNRKRARATAAWLASALRAALVASRSAGLFVCICLSVTQFYDRLLSNLLYVKSRN